MPTVWLMPRGERSPLGEGSSHDTLFRWFVWVLSLCVGTSFCANFLSRHTIAQRRCPSGLARTRQIQLPVSLPMQTRRAPPLSYSLHPCLSKHNDQSGTNRPQDLNLNEKIRYMMKSWIFRKTCQTAERAKGRCTIYQHTGPPTRSGIKSFGPS